jgi:hypothetical protein
MPYEPTIESIDSTVLLLKALLRNEYAKFKCVMHSLGGQTSAAISGLATLRGIRLICSRSSAPKGLRWISNVIPSYSAAVEVVDPDSLPGAYDALADSTLVAIYLLSPDTYETTVETFDKALALEELHKVICAGKKSIIYQVNDNPSAKHGYFTWLLFSETVDESLIQRLVSNQSEAVE